VETAELEVLRLALVLDLESELVGEMLVVVGEEVDERVVDEEEREVDFYVDVEIMIVDEDDVVPTVVEVVVALKFVVTTLHVLPKSPEEMIPTDTAAKTFPPTAINQVAGYEEVSSNAVPLQSFGRSRRTKSRQVRIEVIVAPGVVGVAAPFTVTLKPLIVTMKRVT
jgi:hypothetical protein